MYFNWLLVAGYWLLVAGRSTAEVPLPGLLVAFHRSLDVGCS